jgi:hypothetical protein
MPQDYAASVQGVAIRVTRLTSTGALASSAGDIYVTNSFIRVSFTPEYEAGDEITEKSADGTICVTFKAPDTLKRVNMELAICEPDPDFTYLVSGGILLTKDVAPPPAGGTGIDQSVGWAAPKVGEDPAGNGVAIEAWSRAIQNGKTASSLPYYHWVFPFCKLRQSGDRVIENGLLANTFEGYGVGNNLFGTGPQTTWEYPLATDRPYMYARTTTAPSAVKGFYTYVGITQSPAAPVVSPSGIGVGDNILQSNKDT